MRVFKLLRDCERKHKLSLGSVHLLISVCVSISASLLGVEQCKRTITVKHESLQLKKNQKFTQRVKFKNKTQPFMWYFKKYQFVEV